jgi:hypothetical protein
MTERTSFPLILSGHIARISTCETIGFVPDNDVCWGSDRLVRSGLDIGNWDNVGQNVTCFSDPQQCSQRHHVLTVGGKLRGQGAETSGCTSQGITVTPIGLGAGN